MRTQVAVIGGGPSGLLTSQILMRAGIETVVLERRPRAYVLARIRAGVLEGGTCDMLRRAGVGARMEAEGHRHTGTALAAAGRQFRIDFEEGCGKSVMVYGQTQVTEDLYAAQDALGATILHEVEDVVPDPETGAVTFRHDGQDRSLQADWIVGCDGFHGPSRQAIPESVRTEHERVYPFGWLGVMSETPPVADELIYANHDRGFALCSMRNAQLSRYYIQTPHDDDPAAWSDTHFWDELRRRLPPETAEALVTGPSIEKSIAPLRSFVTEPMRYRKLCLVGDAAHIVPPTGAKGLNLAVSDVHYLTEGLTAWYGGDPEGMERYSERALARVWKASRFSWWMTRTLHNFPGQSAFDQHMQEAEIAYLEGSAAARAAFSENYVGLPF